MRTYYIYRQELKTIGIHLDYDLCRWADFYLLTSVKGTKKLYDLFNHIPSWKKYKFAKSLSDYGYLFRKYDFCYLIHETPDYRYLIIDDKGNVRDYYKLTDKYTVKYANIIHNHHHHNAYQSHKSHLEKHRRKSLSPMEYKEIKDEYGFTLTDKKVKDKWDYFCDYDEGHKKPKNWKSQSKRPKQFKTSAVYYNNNKGIYNV